MTRVIPFILYLILIAFHEVITREATLIVTAGINLSALLVLVVALYKAELTATWFGFFAGLVFMASSPAHLGWHALALAALGLMAYHVREKLNLDSLYAKILLVFGGVLVHNLMVLVLEGPTDFLFRLVTVVLAGAVYTTAIAWVFFLFKEGYITWARVKSLF